MLSQLCLGVLALMSQVDSKTLEGGCIFSYQSIGSFTLESCGDFVGDSVGFRSLEESEKKDLSYFSGPPRLAIFGAIVGMRSLSGSCGR